jgi:uncharacterized protein YbjT (DUF2867 family)
MLRDNLTLLLHDHVTGRAQLSQAGRGSARALPAKRTGFLAGPQIPAKGRENSVCPTTPSRNDGAFSRVVSPPGGAGRAVRVRILVTGVSGYVGSSLVPRLRRDGHEVRGFARSRERVVATGVALDDLVLGDAVTGTGVAEALEGTDAAYYLIHSMEGPVGTGFPEQERRAAEAFGAAARAAGVRRIVYLGGLVPAGRAVSRHLASREAVEAALLGAVPEGLALRASIVIGARSRSFRFLVRLIERLPVLALPAWRTNRTAPIDGRDVIEYLARAATAPAALTGRSWDIGGPEVMTYEELIRRIADAMMVDRPSVGLGLSMTPVASVVAAAIAGEDPALITPLMEGLEGDLLPRDDSAPAAFGVRLHGFEAAVERALREWEQTEEVAAR